MTHRLRTTDAGNDTSSPGLGGPRPHLCRMHNTYVASKEGLVGLRLVRSHINEDGKSNRSKKGTRAEQKGTM